MRWWRPVAVVSAIVVVVAGAAAFQAFGAAPSGAREYVGLSAQRLPFKLTVESDGQTLSLDVTWSALCRGSVRTVRPHAVAIAADGTFSWEGQDVDVIDGGDGDEQRQSYRLQGRRNDDGTLSGTWRADSGYYNGESYRIEEACNTGDVAFSIREGGSTELPPPQVDAAGHLVVSLDASPEVVAVGDDHMWLLGHGPPAPTDSKTPDRPTLTQVDPRTGATTARVALGQVGEYGPAFFTAGEGAAWVLNGGTLVSRIDARTRTLLTQRARAANAGQPISGIAAGAGGLWLMDDAARGRVLRLRTRTGRIARSIPLVPPRRHGCRPDPSILEHMAIGDGAVWVAASTPMTCPARRRRRQLSPYYYTLSRIDARANRVSHTFALGYGFAGPYPALDAPIAAARGGVFGMACPTTVSSGRETLCGHPRLQRLDVRGGPRTIATLHTGTIDGLAVSRNAFWVSEQLGAGPGSALIRIDRATKRRTTVLRTTGALSNVVLGSGALWVVDIAERRLLRVPAA